MARTHGEHLKRMVQMGIDTTEKAEAALAVLSRIAPETMSQEQVAQRWPHVVAVLICESLGYFTPRSAANAVLAFKIKRAFGCEYYCFSAGFERDGWPKEPGEYDRKLREVNERKIRGATGCRRHESHYDRCDFVVAVSHVDNTVRRETCNVQRYQHYPLDNHEFVNQPFEHHGCRHQKSSYMRDYPYALKLVRDLAAGAANPPSLLASWF